jgi:dynein heavy chain
LGRFSLQAELVNAEMLFNLPMSSFPELQLVSAELDKLDKIYSIYAEFKEFEESMSNMLWADLDIVTLTKGTEDMLKKGRRFPKELKDSSTFHKVDSKIAAFQDSIPLISR